MSVDESHPNVYCYFVPRQDVQAGRVSNALPVILLDPHLPSTTEGEILRLQVVTDGQVATPVIPVFPIDERERTWHPDAQRAVIVRGP